MLVQLVAVKIFSSAGVSKYSVSSAGLSKDLFGSVGVSKDFYSSVSFSNVLFVQLVTVKLC